MTKPQDKIDVSKMSITPEPYEKYERRSTPSKYDEIFSKLGENQRLKCQPEAAGRVAAQLKNWLKAHGHKNITTKSRTNCGDGFGGVWWMEVKESEAAKVFKTKIAPKAAWPTIRKAA